MTKIDEMWLEYIKLLKEKFPYKKPTEEEFVESLIKVYEDKDNG